MLVFSEFGDVQLADGWSGQVESRARGKKLPTHAFGVARPAKSSVFGWPVQSCEAVLCEAATTAPKEHPPAPVEQDKSQRQAWHAGFVGIVFGIASGIPAFAAHREDFALAFLLVH